ncbi:MAG: adenosylcobinamide-phosphate synthase [Candidatus Atribacteria bacterium]|nr:adenosylcobinamide-phosphate synthase [Candidatus Atribacteria bacterium]
MTWIGWLIERLERAWFPPKRNFRRELVLGFVVAGVVVGGLGVGYFLLRSYLRQAFFLGFFLVEVFLIFNFLSLRTLLRRGGEVQVALQRGDLPRARAGLRHLVGRDTEHLSQWEVVRGCLESLAENFNDGVVAPLFYIFFLGGLGGLIYKATNTLDSMLGYRDYRYFFFGFASAKLDDILNFLPARLSVFPLSLAAFILGYSGWGALRVALRDARLHPSPNSGWPESTLAGALGVRLGGVNYYQGKREERPFLGDPIKELTSGRIGEALSLIKIAGWLTVGFLGGIGILVGKFWLG